MAKDNNMTNIPEIPKSALREYIDNSQMRIVVDGVFHARMSSAIAEKFDSGVYDSALQEHANCIKELQSLDIKYPGKATPIFYIYIVPDEEFIELLNYPYKNLKAGGKPVASYDIDGFKSAYGTSQNLLTGNDKFTITRHINRIHEYAHLIQHQFAFCSHLFGEGFAELIPWYALEYESKVPEHLDAMKSLEKIYTANELISSVEFSDRVEGRTCSFQPSYISSYLWSRVVVEQIRSKFNLSRKQAIQKFLEYYAFSGVRQQFLVIELANFIGLDADKLLNSNEYQKAVLKQIETESL